MLCGTGQNYVTAFFSSSSHVDCRVILTARHGYGLHQNYFAVHRQMTYDPPVLPIPDISLIPAAIPYCKNHQHISQTRVYLLMLIACSGS